MSNIEVSPFDLLSGQITPYTGFGDPIDSSPEREDKLRSEIEDACNRLEQGFGRQLRAPDTIAKQLDDVINEMWAQDWNPDTADMNLFVTDFGLVLLKAIFATHKGCVILRSETDISHLSIWWSNQGLEAFPFHKVLKRLYDPEGESIVSFVVSLAEVLAGGVAGAERQPRN